MTIDKLKPRERFLLLVALISAMIFAFHTYIYQPKVDEVETLKSELETQLNDLQKEAVLLAKKNELENKYQNITKYLEERADDYLAKQKPEDIILVLNQLLVDKNLDLLNLEPDSLLKEDDIYNIYPISLLVEGQYQDVLDYIIAIEELNYLIIIDRLDINAVDDSLTELVVSIDLDAYLLAKESGDLR